jgi:hypothetical protein
MNLYRIYQSKKDKVIYIVILLMKKTKIHIDLFWYDVHIIVSTLKEFQDYLYKQWIDIKDKWAASWMTVSTSDKIREIYIWLFDSNDKKEHKATAIHEVTHVVYSILNYLQIPQWYSNDELIANMMEYILPKVLDFISNKKRWQKIIKKKNERI